MPYEQPKEGAIATLADLHQESTRTILKALEGRIVAAKVTIEGKLWKLSI